MTKKLYLALPCMLLLMLKSKAMLLYKSTQNRVLIGGQKITNIGFVIGNVHMGTIYR